MMAMPTARHDIAPPGIDRTLEVISSSCPGAASDSPVSALMPSAPYTSPLPKIADAFRGTGAVAALVLGIKNAARKAVCGVCEQPDSEHYQ